jgi:phytoene dehydrogenase-like protein
MTDNDFDVVVVGAGAAGLCCTGTLVEKGLRVALVAETPEVGWNLRPKMVEGNRGFVQHPIWQLGWGGGWWYPLARSLNVPVRFVYSPPLELFIEGSEGPKMLTLSASPSAMMDLFSELSPLPLDEIRPECEALLAEVMAMDWRDLMKLSDVPLREWLEARNANPFFQGLMYLLSANLLETPIDVAEEHISVFGAFGMLRGFVCGETPVASIMPDGWSGLLVPLAQAIEGRGGTILRGQKATDILFEGGRAAGIVLQDGTEVRGKHVALATGMNRIKALLPSMPDAVRKAVDYSAQLEQRDVCVFTVLNEPVVTCHSFCLVADEGGSALAFLYPMHHLAPWSTQPGKQFLVSQKFFTPKEFEAVGGDEGAAEQINALSEQLFPGFTAATEATAIQRHRHHASAPLLHGPKLPRTTDEIPGLWFVSDGSAPVAGVGVDAAAGAGVLGAREIATALDAS